MSQQATSQLGWYQPASSCHSGNTELISFPKSGGGLYFGGLSHSVVTAGYVVIDLTGTHTVSSSGKVQAMNELAEIDFAETLAKAKPQAAHAWLRLPIKDFGTPEELSREFWDALRDDVYMLMKSGEKVIVFCQGGHGRTGMVAAILCHLLNPKAVGPDPIRWVRDRYCEKAVETANQVKYVHKILDLPEPDVTQYIKPTVVYSSYPAQTSTGSTKFNPFDPIVNELYMAFIWHEEHDDHVLARLNKSTTDAGKFVQIVKVHGKSEYLTREGEVVSKLSLMTETEAKIWEAQEPVVEEESHEPQQVVH